MLLCQVAAGDVTAHGAVVMKVAVAVSAVYIHALSHMTVFLKDLCRRATRRLSDTLPPCMRHARYSMHHLFLPNVDKTDRKLCAFMKLEC